MQKSKGKRKKVEKVKIHTEQIKEKRGREIESEIRLQVAVFECEMLIYANIA